MSDAVKKTDRLGDIVTRHPEAVPVLEMYGLDFCCGGNRTVAQAAMAKDIDTNKILAEIDGAIQEAETADGDRHTDWSQATARELAHHIETTHHVFMREQLPRLNGLFAKVTDAHREAHGDMLTAMHKTFAGLREEIEQHLWKEEQVLFPLIRQLDACVNGTGPRPLSPCGTVENPIAQMRHEHDNAGDALARLRELSDDYTPPDDACPSFVALYDGLKALEADLHRHIHLENNILFPSAVALEAKV